jgi:hypothetical protein
MALSAFDDKSRQPQDIHLAITLGDTFVLWNELKRLIAAKFRPISLVWGFTSNTTGWSLRLKMEDRIILYMTPCHGYFFVSLSISDKAVKAAQNAKLPAPILNAINEAKQSPEGRGLRFEIRIAQDVRNIEQLVAVKMAN